MNVTNELFDTLPDPSRPIIGKFATNAPDTSRRAAINSYYRIGTQKAKLVALLAAAEYGLTCAEAAPLLGVSRNQTATRMGELREDGWAEHSRGHDGKVIERPTDTLGNTGIVHVLTSVGRSSYLRVAPEPITERFTVRTDRPETYEKLPVQIEAFLYTGQNAEAIADWAMDHKVDGIGATWNGPLEIDTLEGTMTAQPGDYIIRGVQGEFYPCKPDIFRSTYRAV